MWIAILAAALLGLLAYWELDICEGAHLGRRFVVWIYDLAALRFERIKEFDPDWEQRFLGEPIARTLGSLSEARVLDVGAGTGRVARAFLPVARLDAQVLCLEPSRRMMRVGRSLLQDSRGRWLRGWSNSLPFAERAFDAVTCLEVLEFTPNPPAALQELVRVLRPGGWLVITNRIGWRAPLILGRTYSKTRFANLLRQAGLRDVQIYPWQVDYDIAWARKPLIISAADRAAKEDGT
ncbi:MAG: class I SAM-dependent methyltransferase [Anaerolineales bacterium]|jgi:ubiquinone/menaquinone biosynthesis C-methylase UbiE